MGEHVSTPLATALRDVPGKWAAVDRASGDLVMVEDTAYALGAALRRAGIKNVAIVRAPDPSEPELVGIG